MIDIVEIFSPSKVILIKNDTMLENTITIICDPKSYEQITGKEGNYLYETLKVKKNKIGGNNV